jgi:hypothetical protein
LWPQQTADHVGPDFAQCACQHVLPEFPNRCGAPVYRRPPARAAESLSSRQARGT